MSRTSIVILTLLVAGLAWIAVPIVQSDQGVSDVTEENTTLAGAEAFVGQSLDEAYVTLGTPTKEEQFVMNTGVQEFRIELRNIYNDVSLASEPPTLKEVTWRRSVEKNLTLWFAETDGAWRAVYGKSWHPDSEF